MGEKLVIYKYDTIRNNRVVSQSVKKELFEGSSCCFTCGSIRFLKVIPYVPIMLGGNIVDKSNLRLSCVRCSSIKTKVDKIIVKGLKTLNILSGRIGLEIDSLWSLDLLKRFYFDNFDLIRKKFLDDRRWDKSDKEIIRVKDN
jgi:uncharacterized phage-like protein YoqJ